MISGTNSINYDVNKVITDNLEECVIILNKNLKCEYCKDENLKCILNLDTINLINKNIIDNLFKNQREKAHEFFNKVLQEGEVSSDFKIENPKKTKSAWFGLTAKRFHDKNDQEKIILFFRNISELKESEEKFRFMANNINDLISIYDKNLNLVYINDVLEEISGFKKEEVYGKKSLNYIHPNDVQNLANTFKKAVKEGHGRGTWRMRKKDGKYVWIEADGKVTKDSSGNTIVIVVSRDITKRKELEEKIRKSGESYRNRISHLTDAIFEVNANGRIDYMSPQMHKLFGYTLKDLAKIKVNQLVHPDDLELIFKRIKESVMKDINLSIEVRLKHKGGGFIPTSIRGSFILINGQTKLIGVLRDITERYYLEKQLKQSEKMYRELFENSPFSIVLMDMDGNIIDINDKFEEIYGYSKRDVIHNSPFTFTKFYAHPKDFKNHLKTIFKGKNIEKQELFIKTKKQGNIWVEIQATHINIMEKDYIQFFSQDITERKEAEIKLKDFNKLLENKVEKRTEELQKSEQKYREMIEYLDVGYFHVDLEGNLLFHNSGFNKIYGDNEDENLIGLNAKNFWKDPSMRHDYLNTLIQKNHVENYQISGLKVDGEEIIVEINAHLIRDQDNNPISIEGTATDVSSKVELMNLLKESEQKFRTIAESALMGILIIQDNQIRYVNKKLAEMLKYDIKEIYDWSPGELIKTIHPDDVEMVMDHITRRQFGIRDDVNHYQFRGITKYEEIIWFEVFAQGIKYNGRKADLGVLIDITDRKQTLKALTESEQKFRTISENSSLGIMIVKDGIILYANQALGDINEHSIEEMKQWRKNEFVRKIHPDDMNKVWEQIQQRQRGDKEASLHVNFRLITKSKRIKWVETFSKNISYQEQDAQLLLIMDVTDKMQALRKLKESKERLREQNIELKNLDSLKNDFLTITAHELKTPLISILGYTELIMTEEKELNPELMDYLSRIQKNSERLQSYIEQILDVMKIDTDKVEINLMPQKVNDLFLDCILELQVQLKQRNLELIMEIPEDLELLLDSVKFQQIIMNLVSNAIKYNHEGGLIEISAEKRPKEVLFRVRDNGEGLSEYEIQHVFDKFVRFRTDIDKESRNQKGTGLGLYITKAFIEAHGGSIWVESEGKTKGTTFSFTIPS